MYSELSRGNDILAPVSAPSKPNDSNFSLETISPENKGNAELDLSKQELADQDIEVVIQYALENRKVKTTIIINRFRNFVFQLTQPFEKLDISSNKIGSKGIEILCDALEKNSVRIIFKRLIDRSNASL